jgi:alpha-L-rhamnosidase
LSFACGRLKTLYGELVSDWKVNNGAFEWTVVVPPNTTATLYLPVPEKHNITLNGQAARGSVHEVEAGEYHFVVA